MKSIKKHCFYTVSMLIVLFMSFQLLSAEDNSNNISKVLKDNPSLRQQYDMQKLINPKKNH